MKVVPYIGDTAVTSAAQAPCTADEVVLWLQTRLSDRLAALDDAYVGCVTDAPVPRRMARRRARNPGGSRRPAARSGRSIAAGVTLAPYLPVAGPNAAALGVFLQLVFSAPYRASAARQYTLLNALLSDLEATLRTATYRIANDDGSTLTGYASTAAGAESGPILDALSFPPFAGIDRLVRVSGGAANLTNADRTALAVTVLTPTPPGDGWPANPPRRAPFIWERGVASDYDALLRGRDPNYATRTNPLIWVPDQLARIFYDSVESDSLYGLDTGIYTYRTTLAGQVKVPRGHLPFYAVVDNALWAADLAKPTNTWPSDGVGGQGAMRCDPRPEYDAVAAEDNLFGRLSRALDLPTAAVAGAQVTLEDRYDTCLGMASTIRYGKRYKATAANAKRNRPKTTRPLVFTIPAKAVGDKKTPQMRQLLDVARLQKKQKGVQGANGRPAGIPVAKPTADRLSANMVMKSDIVARFGAGALAPLAWAGSATELVDAVFATDPAARTFWAARSAGLKTWEDTDAGADKRVLIRTDQEWCHLFGHGDGGSEVPDNFVAGSKHCNTEQLALELTQRIYRDKTLTVKITAYLMPSALACHQANWRDLKTAFPAIERYGLINAPNLQQIVEASPGNAPPATFRSDQMIAVTNTVASYLEARARAGGSRWTLTLSGQVINAPGQADFAQGASGPALARTAGDRAAWALFPLLPVAYMMRYKVFVGARRRKAIDHLFAGQREEMDFYEFQLLQWLFRLKIAAACAPADLQAVSDLLTAKGA